MSILEMEGVRIFGVMDLPLTDLQVPRDLWFRHYFDRDLETRVLHALTGHQIRKYMYSFTALTFRNLYFPNKRARMLYVIAQNGGFMVPYVIWRVNQMGSMYYFL